MRAFFALARMNIVEPLAPRTFALFGVLGVGAFTLAYLARGAHAQEVVVERTASVLTLATVASFLLAAALGAGAAYRDRQTGHKESALMAPLSPFVYVLGSVAGTLVVALLGWAVILAVGWGGLAITTGLRGDSLGTTLGMLAPPASIHAEKVEGGSGDGPWMLVDTGEGASLRFVFAGEDVDGSVREGELRWERILRPAGASELTRMRLVFSRASLTETVSFAEFRPGESLRFEVPLSIAEATGPLSLDVEIGGRKVDFLLDADSILLRGDRGFWGTTLAVRLGILSLALGAILLLAFSMGQVGSPALSILLAASWTAVGLAHPFLDSAVEAELDYHERMAAHEGHDHAHDHGLDHDHGTEVGAPWTEEMVLAGHWLARASLLVVPDLQRPLSAMTSRDRFRSEDRQVLWLLSWCGIFALFAVFLIRRYPRWRDDF